MSTCSTINERVYPIRGSIRLEVEVDDIKRSNDQVFSNPVKIGKCDWCFNVGKGDQFLKVRLWCITEMEQEDTVELKENICLINQKKPTKHFLRDLSHTFERNSMSKGYGEFIEYSKILSDGYVKDGKIVLVCDITIKSENFKRRKCDFNQERPSDMDLKNIMKVANPSKIEQFEEEFAVSEVSKNDNYSDSVTVFGVPVKIFVKKTMEDGEDYMSLYVYLNEDDKSDWWRCRVWRKSTIVNRTDMEKSFSKWSFNTFKVGYSNWGMSSFLKWSELVDPSNGYVKDGKFKILVSIQMLEMYGFDKNTRRGIDKPMRKMTDAVITVEDEELYICKKILAQQSSYFKTLFSSNPEKGEFDLENFQLDDIIRFLELVHNVDTKVCEENVEAVLKLIRFYQALECYERLDSILEKLEFKDALKMLALVEKYPLPKLRNKFLLNLRDEELLKSITHSPKYRTLSNKMKVAILEWKLIPEEFRTIGLKSTGFQFRTDFSKESDLTDIKINVNDYIYHASKQILANASHFFMKKFYGPYSEDTSEVTVFDVKPRELEMLFTHIYHPTRPVTSANIDSLLQLAHQFSVPRLMDKCEEYLVIKDNIPLIDKLEYAGKFDLPYLLESCLKFAKDSEKMKEVKEHPKFPNLASKVNLELNKRASE